MSQPGQSVVVGRLLVIGVGNEYRRDDAVGLIVARRLAERPNPTFTVLEQNGDGAALMETWQGAEKVIVVDAVHSGAEPGTTYRLDASLQSLTALAALPPEAFRGSTHAFSLVEAVELSRTLHQLPPHFIVYGIEGRNFEAGTGLSSEVAKAVPRVANRILLEVSSARRNPLYARSR
ncbi:MAG TPA: hydrogenase maturation protease [Terriglobia bacterium]|nr:hydrogenase maturation protease [Terriglobia bacterium]